MMEEGGAAGSQAWGHSFSSSRYWPAVETSTVASGAVHVEEAATFRSEKRVLQRRAVGSCCHSRSRLER